MLLSKRNKLIIVLLVSFTVLLFAFYKFTGGIQCGVACHGVDDACGYYSPSIRMCTLEYSTDDICQQFVDCRVQWGMCKQIQNEQLTRCVSCVQKCFEDHSRDPILDDVFKCAKQCPSQVLAR